jgi:hypothetical protein
MRHLLLFVQHVYIIAASECEAEARALLSFAAYPDGFAMSCHYFPGYSQSQSGARLSMCFVRFVKTIKYVVNIFKFDTRATVLD